VASWSTSRARGRAPAAVSMPGFGGVLVLAGQGVGNGRTARPGGPRQEAATRARRTPPRTRRAHGHPSACILAFPASCSASRPRPVLPIPAAPSSRTPRRAAGACGVQRSSTSDYAAVSVGVEARTATATASITQPPPSDESNRLLCRAGLGLAR
jgi:hypothetical protein